MNSYEYMFSCVLFDFLTLSKDKQTRKYRHFFCIFVLSLDLKIRKSTKQQLQFKYIRKQIKLNTVIPSLSLIANNFLVLYDLYSLIYLNKSSVHFFCCIISLISLVMKTNHSFKRLLRFYNNYHTLSRASTNTEFNPNDIYSEIHTLSDLLIPIFSVIINFLRSA